MGGSVEGARSVTIMGSLAGTVLVLGDVGCGRGREVLWSRDA